MIGSALVLAAAIAARFGTEVHRLLFEPEGPIDLLLLRGLIRDWFDGLPVYVERKSAVHPPANFLLLWPLYGWTPEGLDRWFYAVITSLATAGLVAILVREARPASRADRVLLGALVVGCYPTAISLGIGQMTVIVLLTAIAAVLIALRQPPALRRDLALAGLFLFALVKPNLTLPFFWVIAFRPGWTRPAAFALLGYLAVSALSIVLHGTGLDAVRELIASWYRRGERGFAYSGYGNLHSWLGDMELRQWIFPASAAVFALHGVWAWRNRDADPWVRIGVAAIVARLWAYHRLYDDLLMIFPLVALYRLARGRESARGAATLFVLSSVTFVAPITWVVEHASWALVGLWLLQLAFLLTHPRRRRASEPAAEPVSAA
ncbi:MAG TPA: glycosyltransferase 87 family protein [Gemmatimonadota bacterium]|nr:glycosyltransferase 87 family protein [Gemmatimonadota bacterium]